MNRSSQIWKPYYLAPMKKYFRVIIFFNFLTLLASCNPTTETNKVMIAKNGLPAVKSLISKPELNGLAKKKSTSKESAIQLISALTGYNEKLIKSSIDLISDNNDVDFGKLGQKIKTLSIEVGDESYSSVVTATAASLLLNNHPIIEAGDTKKGCVIKAKIEATLYSLSGVITVWIEPKDGKVMVYGKSELNQAYDPFGVNDKGLLNVMDGINKTLGYHQSFDEAYNKE